METLLIRSRPAGSSTALPRMPLEISGAFIDRILTPYRDNVRYLKAARIVDCPIPGGRQAATGAPMPMVTIEGRFSIDESCYIDDTGHFNAVEFNICYNQLAYVLFGKCLQADLFRRVVPDWEQRTTLTYDDFLVHQLSSMYIAKIEGSFLKPLDSRDFSARLSILRILWTGDSAFVRTEISFSDAEGVKAKGPVLLAFNTSSQNQH